MLIKTINVYENFCCTASSCKDNCCIGWEIDIDEKTNIFYGSVTGKFGEKLKNSITTTDLPHFILEGERCPFLNKDNLCEIITELGEEHLCEICENHPRFYEWFGGITEVGLGLCCEEANRLLFSSSQKLYLIESENSDAPDTSPFDKALYESLLFAREVCFKILQNRELSVEIRAFLLLNFAEELQLCIDNNIVEIKKVALKYGESSYLAERAKGFCDEATKGLISEKRQALTEFISFFKTLEPFDNAWQEKLEKVKEKPDIILIGKEEFKEYYKNMDYEYEHLIFYFIYRYFMKAVYDEDLLSKVKLAVISYLLVAVLDVDRYLDNDKKFMLADRIEITKAFSKEIEYSLENIYSIADEGYLEGALSLDSLINLLGNTVGEQTNEHTDL